MHLPAYPLHQTASSRANADRMTKPFYSPHAPDKYRPDIDGLRTFAVFSVVLYHAFPQLVRGGFVGVDIFFVISGFLISKLLFTEMTEHRFSFTIFYGRRIRRIFPALAVCLAAVLAYGFVVLTPPELAQLGKHVFFGAAFLSNIVLWSESGYFDSAATYKPLLHLCRRERTEAPSMNLGPNEALIGADGLDWQLSTPTLLLDLDGFEANLATMADAAARAGRKLRPHVKAHKSTRVARRQIEAGAIGLCCATAREAEIMAAAGLDGILAHHTRWWRPRMLERLMAARERDRRSRRGGRLRGRDRRAGGGRRAQERPIGVLIDIDMGQSRTGVVDFCGMPYVLARHVARQPGLSYRGVQAYYGHLQHVPTLTERRAKVREKWARLNGFLDALSSAGLLAEIVSGGGTGTHHLDLGEGRSLRSSPAPTCSWTSSTRRSSWRPDGPPFRTALTIADARGQHRSAGPRDPGRRASRRWRLTPGRPSSLPGLLAMPPTCSWVTSTAGCSAPTAQRSVPLSPWWPRIATRP